MIHKGSSGGTLSNRGFPIPPPCPLDRIATYSVGFLHLGEQLGSFKSSLLTAGLLLCLLTSAGTCILSVLCTCHQSRLRDTYFWSVSQCCDTGKYDNSEGTYMCGLGEDIDSAQRVGPVAPARDAPTPPLCLRLTNSAMHSLSRSGLINQAACDRAGKKVTGMVLSAGRDYGKELN